MNDNDLRERLHALMDDADSADLIAIHNTLVAECERLEEPGALRELRYATNLRQFPSATKIRQHLTGPQIED